MNWIPLTSVSQLEDIRQKSHDKTQLIFKHSTRCVISSMSLNRLERETQPENADFYFLDLIANRDISNAIAEKFNVHHESPQILVLRNGECIYDESHSGINMDEIKEQIA